MSTREIVKRAIEDQGRQLKVVIQGMPEAGQDLKITSESMTPRSIVEHLCEVYQAVLDETSGKKHDWGTFSLEDNSWGGATDALWRMRQEAAKAVDQEDEKLSQVGIDYIVSHDAYHVGQLVLVRMQADPDWDADSIYAEE